MKVHVIMKLYLGSERESEGGSNDICIKITKRILISTHVVSGIASVQPLKGEYSCYHCMSGGEPIFLLQFQTDL